MLCFQIMAAMAQCLLSIDEMRRAEAHAGQHGVDTHQLMANAGKAVADYIMAHHPKGRVLIACGPGNNGGDGMVAACALANAEREVAVVCYGAFPPKAAEAARAWQQLQNTGVPILTAHPDDMSTYAVVVDALFGAGLARPLEAPLDAWFAQWRHHRVPVVAVDLPSGLDGDAAQPLGDIYAPATATIAFAPPRPAHYVMPARQLIGARHIVDIGIPAPAVAAVQPQSWLNEPSQWQARLPRWDAAAHKYTRGAALVLSGPLFHTGAAQLSTLAVLHIGAGLVTLAGPRRALATAQLPPEVMLAPIDASWRARWQLQRLCARLRVKAILLGPNFAGQGALRWWRTRHWVEAALRLPLRVVLDADALSAFARHPASPVSGAGRP